MGRWMGARVAEGGSIGDSGGSKIVKMPHSNCIGVIGNHFTPDVINRRKNDGYWRVWLTLTFDLGSGKTINSLKFHLWVGLAWW